MQCVVIHLSVALIPQESTPLKGGRGSASMVQKCKLCARENSIGRHKHSTYVCHFDTII